PALQRGRWRGPRHATAAFSGAGTCSDRHETANVSRIMARRRTIGLRKRAGGLRGQWRRATYTYLARSMPLADMTEADGVSSRNVMRSWTPGLCALFVLAPAT